MYLPCLALLPELSQFKSTQKKNNKWTSNQGPLGLFPIWDHEKCLTFGDQNVKPVNPTFCMALPSVETALQKTISSNELESVH